MIQAFFYQKNCKKKKNGALSNSVMIIFSRIVDFLVFRGFKIISEGFMFFHKYLKFLSSFSSVLTLFLAVVFMGESSPALARIPAI